MYRANELSVLQQTSKKSNVKIFEYENGEWTFHAKGAWFYEKEQSTPSMTVIGSSNYSYRSNRRDTEAQLYMVSDCPTFRENLHQECQHLYGKATEMSVQTVKDDGVDRLTRVERVLNKVLKILL